MNIYSRACDLKKIIENELIAFCHAILQRTSIKFEIIND